MLLRRNFGKTNCAACLEISDVVQKFRLDCGHEVCGLCVTTCSIHIDGDDEQIVPTLLILTEDEVFRFANIAHDAREQKSDDLDALARSNFQDFSEDEEDKDGEKIAPFSPFSR